MRFTNLNVINEEKQLKKWFLISIVLFIFSLVLLFFFAGKEYEEYSLHELILQENNVDKNAYINAEYFPYLFGEYEDDPDKLYMVFDDKYNYIVKMSESEAKEMEDAVEKGKKYKVDGLTKTTTSDIKKIAIDFYNESVSEENKVILADFDNLFGTIYIDSDASKENIGIGIGFIITIFTITFMFILMVFYINFKRSVKKLSDSEVINLDSQMNDKDAFYYGKASLYLTKDYIVKFNNKLEAIEYKNVIWIYPKIYKTNGIETVRSIFIMTKEGKRKEIAKISTITKNLKAVYEEVYTTLSEKCPNALFGYTAENKIEAKNRINI